MRRCLEVIRLGKGGKGRDKRERTVSRAVGQRGDEVNSEKEGLEGMSCLILWRTAESGTINSAVSCELGMEGDVEVIRR